MLMDCFRMKRKKVSNGEGETTAIARKWKLLSGANSWEGLLDPLDIDLRRYIIGYGERAQATYDAFISEKASKYAGSSKYAKDTLFSKVGIDRGNPFKYRITKYLYATSSISLPDAFIVKSWSREAWNKESNWIGFVCVATDEGKIALGRRDILIAWRGTIRTLEWMNDLQFGLVSAPEIFGGNSEAKVHLGWHSIYTSNDARSTFNRTSVRTQVLEEVRSLVETYKTEELSITITGHSLGAAVSTLNAVDIIINGYNKPHTPTPHPIPVTAFLFASPRVGDDRFRHLFSSFEDLHLLRIRNSRDIVPTYPPHYAEVGLELELDSHESGYLKIPGDVHTWHSLEVYLHCVAGTQGSKGGFKLEVERDVSLVNKHLDVLKDEYCVPTSWWCERNKGMMQMEDGRWELMDHEEAEEEF